MVLTVYLLVFCFTFKFCYCTQSQNSSGVYRIVAHGKLVPNSIYSVIVDTDGNFNETQITAVIYGKNEENDTISLNKSVTVKNRSTEVIELNITNLTDGQYFLNISANSGLNFSHHTQLYLESKQLSLFVQTDKAMYKPGEKVRFRVFAVHQNFLSAFSEKVYTEVRDSNGNVLRVFNSVVGESGAASFELQLSDEPNLGEWLITGQIANQTFKKPFTVATYVLPLFDVQINAPSIVKTNKTEIAIEVKASYTYGKPVKGDLQLRIYDSYAYPKQLIYELLSKIKGEVTVPIKMKDILQRKVYYTSAFNVEVSVQDSSSHKVYNKTHQINVYENDINFEILNSNKNFKHGVNYTLILRAVDRDWKPKIINKTNIKVYYGFGTGNYENKLDTEIVDGIIKVVLTTNPPEFERVDITSTAQGTVKVYHYADNSTISIQVEYENANISVSSLYAQKNQDACFAQLAFNQTIQSSFEVGEQFKLTLDSNIAITEYMYQIITKKGILLHKKVEMKEASKEHSIDVTVNHDMTPKARVIVHFACNNSVGVDAIEFKVNGTLRTKVNISTNVEETEPGSNVSITFNSQIPSSLHILGIDQKMLLLKSGNDIEMKNVDDEIQKYVGCHGNTNFDSCTHHYYYHWDYRRSIFSASGLHIFSSFFNYTEYEVYPIYRQQFNAASAGSSYMDESVMDDDVESTPAPQARSFGKMASYKKMGGGHERQRLPVTVRQFFPETWLWETLQTNQFGNITITRKVPDTITSWFITSIAVNNETGFGLTDKLTALRVYRQFFITLNLPYSIIRGESTEIEIMVSNYMETAQNTRVTLENKGEFTVNAREMSNNVDDGKDPLMKVIIVPPNDAVTVTFQITAKKVGFIDIKVTAVGDESADAVSGKLVVKPEGETIRVNRALLVSLNNQQQYFHQKVKIEIPKNLVPDSQRISIAVVGDIIGNVINNIDHLLQMPCGCGEQNMVNFVPNVVVLDYLTKSKKLTKRLKTKAMNNIEIGYQRQLKYRHFDGSFSAFGVGDTNGSTWLTAFVVKSFIQAKAYIHIDKNVLNRSINFLLKQQNKRGEFVENGNMINKAMQSATADGSAALSAYVLIALSTKQNMSKKVSAKLRVTLEYLSNHLKNSSDVYELAIIAYALHLNNHSEKDNAFKKLYEVANKTEEHIYWHRNKSQTQNDFAAVEITSYALQTLLLRNDSANILSIIRWLISKQNCFGGYSSTQNTVVAIEALAKFAANVSSENTQLDFNFIANKKQNVSLTINKNETLALREILMSKKTKWVNVTVSGLGSAAVYVSWQYNRIVPKVDGFALNHTFQEKLNNSFKLHVCARDQHYTNTSGMVVMQITLPSGFASDVEWLESIKSETVKRTDSTDENTEVVIYFERLTNAETCVVVAANRVAIVHNLKPSTITIYDYYNSTKKTTTFYSFEQYLK